MTSNIAPMESELVGLCMGFAVARDFALREMAAFSLCSLSAASIVLLYPQK